MKSHSLRRMGFFCVDLFTKSAVKSFYILQIQSQTAKKIPFELFQRMGFFMCRQFLLMTVFI